jgi:DNA-binding response OmpR family regulator
MTITTEDFIDAAFREHHCDTCGQPVRERVDYGPLTMMGNPDRAYWCGEPIYGLTNIQCRILRLLVRYRRVDFVSLYMCLNENTTDQALKVHISIIRRALDRVSRSRTVIHSLRGWGYELVVKDTP